ncbi:acyl-CoA dehydrogenase [Actinomadura craniellae]|uniref:Acyl-CoA dehydrogenase n=1 Tax=Actinomadura craniellae TaxID=2231787 RepID=A0A365HD72_9ACTN|nr:acyl-CoA dehydrogenase family protein [Actinomadura craniellae]RAY16213.1 acyl-CoA dehydrogenase [Actinomadura craniellae]
MNADLLYGEDEDQLRAAVRELLADRAPWPAVLARTESADPYDLDLWRALAGDVGCAGLLVPEELGGAGATLREAAVVAEETGRAVAPVPFLGSAVTATALLLALPGTEEMLRELAEGRSTAALAVPFTTPPHAEFPGTVTADGDRLTGRITSVADALPADVLLVPAGGALYAVAGADTTRTPVTSLDMTRALCDIDLDGAPGRPLATGDAARDALARALSCGAAVLASEQLGLAERCLEITVEYVKGRYQFGRPVGSYQGLKHRLAELWVAITQARAVARYAASCAAGDDAETTADTAVAVAVAQAHCSVVAVRAAEECVQMHGGIGFTWEHPAHLYLKRAKSTALAHGTPGRHRTDLAALIDLAPA